MTGILVTGLIVTLWRLAWGPLPALPVRCRRAPFRLAAAWYEVGPVARHRADPDPGRDWSVW